MAALSQEALKETAFAANLRNVDALAHVVRAFEDPSIPHVGPIDPLRDIKNIDFDLIVNDLGQVEKRLERVEKDLKKMKSAEIEREHELLKRAKVHLETERPLREMEMTPEDKKRVRGFMFLSEKPILYVLNIGESPTLGKDLEEAVAKYGIDRSCLASEHRRHRGVRQGRSRAGRDERRRCRRISLQLWPDRERTGAPHPQDLRVAGADLVLHRRRRRMPRLDGGARLQGGRMPRARFIPISTKHFIRAETIHWDQLLEAGSEAEARARGTLRLEGKEYIVKDGDVMHIRHSG